jgi:hypothetical protein
MLNARAVLLTSTAALALLAGACNMNEPSYFPAPAPVEIGGGAGATMTDPFAVVELPFRAPSADDEAKLREESQQKGFTVPWLRTDNVAVSILYTITNLGDKDAQATLEVDGASEFANYDVIALRAQMEMAAINNEDEVDVLPLLEIKPNLIPPGQQFTGMFREDDLEEAALDLDALARFGAAPAAVLVNQSKKSNIGLEGMPPQHVRPALWRLRVALSGNGHLRLDMVVRVRDGASQLATSGTAWAPAPAAYTPPMMPTAP